MDQIPPNQLNFGSLIQEGFYDKLVIIGYPYDEGAKKDGAKGGQDLGPDSFRRFIVDIGSVINPEYTFDISDGLPKISDYGNIQIISEYGKQAKPSQIDLMNKLATKIHSCIKRHNIPFIIGGTRDVTYSTCQAVCQTKLKTQMILIRNTFDIQEIPTDFITQNNSLQKILLQPGYSDSVSTLLFGVNSNDKSIKDLQVVSLQDIRKTQTSIPSEMMQPLTQAGVLFTNILQKATEDQQTDQIVLSISLEAIHDVFGVQNKCESGLSTEEIIEILKLAGYYSQKIVAVEISDYNPFIEDWSTGRLVASMFYWFALGLSMRLSINKLIQ